MTFALLALIVMEYTAPNIVFLKVMDVQPCKELKMKQEDE
jgi:hypothetical protein